MAEPVQNSKPLLVSELVNNYKGMNTSTISEPANADSSMQKTGVAIENQPLSSKVIADYAN